MRSTGLFGLAALALVGSANAGAVELDQTNFDTIVTQSGKAAFVKFLAPWCGHCKSMKPDWDKLGDKFKDSDVIIGDVDCTTDAGKPLCSKFGVKGYPTIKTFGSNPMGEDYKGGRKYDDLEKHVTENMGPSCGPDNKDKCSADELKELEELLKMPFAERKEKAAAAQAEMDKVGADFEDFVKGLQESYEKAQKDKDEAEAALGPKLKMLFASTKGDSKDEL